MMKNPKLYEQSNSVSRLLALDIIKEHSSKILWRKDWDSVIDLGSGDGSVTSLIKKQMPCTNVKFVGSDINENMVKYANEHHGKENITFRLLDMSRELPDDLKCAFNHVFSFCMLNCIKDQAKAFKNVFDLMTDKGDCLLAILKYVPSYEFFIEASKKKKWSSCLKDVDTLISPYYEMEDAVAIGNITNIMENIGFNKVDVQSKQVSYPLENGTELKNLFKSINPYNIPDDVFEELTKDCVDVAKDLGLLDHNDTSFQEHEEQIPYKMSVFIVFATKK